jgi:hypothetical protein
MSSTNMKYLLITFSFLAAGITSHAQVKTNAGLCSCSNNVQINKPTLESVTATTVNLQWTTSFNYAFTIRYGDITSGGAFDNNQGPITNGLSNPRKGTANNLQPGHTYTFSIHGEKTCTGDNCTEWVSSTDSPSSDQILLIPAVPDPSITAVAANTFQITYPGIYGASDYRIDVATDAAFTNFVTGFNNVNTGGALNPTIFNCSPGVTYYYRARATNGAGASTSSTTKSVVTLANPPTLSASTSVTASSFIANWAAATGATSYQIDVATDAGFTAFVSGFVQLPVTGTTKSITGLQPGTTYFYRVRSVNSANATSAFSTASQQLTLPAKPGISSSAITTSSYSINWTAIQSATGYQLDVSTNDTFTDLITGFNSKSVTGTSTNIPSLTPGTNYYTRLRSVNGTGLSASSDALNTITVPSAPVALAATTAGTDRFTANWNQVTGAASYRLDVATDDQFANILTSASNVSATGIAKVFTALSRGTTYYYRIRAVNAGGTSANSNIISQLTLPDAPNNFAISEITAATMKTSWNAVQSATEYHIYVSNTLAFDDILPDYNPLVVASSITEKVLNTNLQPSTVYYLRLRAKNSTGLSGFSEIKTVSTLSGSGGDDLDIKLTDLTSPSSVALGSSSTLTFKLDGGFGVLHTKLYHRKKTESDFISSDVTTIKGTNTITIDDTWLDDIGMEFYVETTDDGGHAQRSATKTILIHIANVTVPVSSFGKDVNNYHIIAVPYNLATTKMADLFEPINGLGSYNEAHWRLVHYKDGNNQDYRDGLSVSNIERGAGYWFISKDNVDISFGQANTFDNSLDQPFQLSLKKGWNQIGNPVNRMIKWDNLTSLPENSNVKVSKLLTYVNETISLDESNELKPFEGGFVYADENSVLTFPVTLNAASSGRKQSPADESLAGDWMLPIQVSQDRLISNISGIGMHHAASDDKDRLDLPTPPAFVRYVDFSSQGLSRNVIKTTDSFTWGFTLTSDLNNAITLKWDNTSVDGQLVMHDKHANKLINMNKVSSYVASPSSDISIYYDRNKNFEGTEVSLGIAYPNPFKEITTIQFDYVPTNAMLVVLDLNGAEVARLNSSSSDIGWNGKNSQGNVVSPGMYIYRLYTGSAVYTGKIIKQ